jgi:hypothetical protein
MEIKQHLYIFKPMTGVDGGTGQPVINVLESGALSGWLQTELQVQGSTRSAFRSLLMRECRYFGAVQQ